ncbi:MAG: hypothetical protein ACRDP6_32960 [Actinoallomurus sp.]
MFHDGARVGRQFSETGDLLVSGIEIVVLEVRVDPLNDPVGVLIGTLPESFRPSGDRTGGGR